MSNNERPRDIMLVRWMLAIVNGRFSKGTELDRMLLGNFLKEFIHPFTKEVFKAVNKSAIEVCL